MFLPAMYMHYILATLKWSIVILILLVATVLLIPLGMMLLGYKVNADSGQIAELAVEKGDIAICDSIINYGIFGPPSDESRAHCVFRYAKLTKDPTACELLLPGDYGLSCIGEIWGRLIDESNCHWYKEDAVRCFEGEDLKPHVYYCEEEQIELLPNECKHRIAFKHKQENFCETISHPILRSICKVRIATWNQYPDLRSTIYFNDNID